MEDKFFHNKIGRETGSLEGEVMQFFRDKFPGKDCVLDNLPRLGLIFLRFFRLYNRIKLKPYFPFKGFPTKVKLSIMRFGDSTMVIPALERGPQFSLIGLNPFWQEFKIEPKHIGKDFLTVAEKFMTWLSGRISERVNIGEFYLVLSDESENLLRQYKNSALDYFLFMGRIFDLQRIQPMKIRLIKNGLPVQGLVMPQKDDYLFVHWNSIFPASSEHYKLIELVSRWHQKWCDVLNIMSANDVCIDVDRLWEDYQSELSQYKHLLDELEEDE